MLLSPRQRRGARLKCELVAALRAAVDDELSNVTTARAVDLARLITAVETLTKFSWTTEIIVAGWAGRLTVLDRLDEVARTEPDEAEAPPVPLSIKRSHSKYGDDTDPDTNEPSIQRLRTFATANLETRACLLRLMSHAWPRLMPCFDGEASEVLMHPLGTAFNVGDNHANHLSSGHALWGA